MYLPAGEFIILSIASPLPPTTVPSVCLILSLSKSILLTVLDVFAPIIAAIAGFDMFVIIVDSTSSPPLSNDLAPLKPYLSPWKPTSQGSNIIAPVLAALPPRVPPHLAPFAAALAYPAAPKDAAI